MKKMPGRCEALSYWVEWSGRRAIHMMAHSRLGQQELVWSHGRASLWWPQRLSFVRFDMMLMIHTT